MRQQSPLPGITFESLPADAGPDDRVAGRGRPSISSGRGRERTGTASAGTGSRGETAGAASAVQRTHRTAAQKMSTAAALLRQLTNQARAQPITSAPYADAAARRRRRRPRAR